jgi:hypothetical protein
MPPLIPSLRSQDVVPAGVKCSQHPQVAATRRCRLCGGFMCETCDFSLPGDVHICPICAAKPQTDLSPRRKKFLWGSYALAIWSTVGMVCLVSGVFGHRVTTKAEQELLGIVLLFFVLFPAIIGLALGVSARERRLPSPPSLWIAIAWNGIIVGIFMLLMIVGNMK